MKQVFLSLITGVTAFLLASVAFYSWAFYQAKNADGCDSFVIDSYEVHSGIDIPNVEVINCYYDEEKGVRTSIYFLKEPLKTDNFVTVDYFTLAGNELLNLEEKPNKDLLLTQGKRWNRKWTYLLEPKSSRLWVEIEF